MPASPRLTMIIPTRERHDTLVHALRTCTSQDCDDLEILVSDNASTDATREVVAACDDPRVRYVNPGERRGMAEHWEFAIGHVHGGHVGFLGDDDGMMPGAATEILDVLSGDPADALVWPLFSYYWPSFFDTSVANCLSMRLPQPHVVGSVDARAALRDVAAFRAPHYVLPSPYWGVVSRAAVDRVVAASGRMFSSITPDLYAGAAVAAVSDRYLRTPRAMTLSGASKHSNGANQVTGDEGAVSPTAAFLAENALPFHAAVDYAPNVCVLLTEVLLQVRDQVADDVPVPDLAAMFAAALRHPDHVIHPAVQPEVTAALRRTAERHGLGATLEAELRRQDRQVWRRRGTAAVDNLLRGNPLFDCAPLGAGNIYDATHVADRLRSARTGPLGAATFTWHGRAVKARRALAFARRRW